MRIFFLFLIILLHIGMIKIIHFSTAGFRVDKTIPFKNKIINDFQIPTSINKDILKIFDQGFRYLDKGCQVYVFESDDKEYVLKIIRTSKYKPPFWCNLISFYEEGKRLLIDLNSILQKLSREYDNSGYWHDNEGLLDVSPSLNVDSVLRNLTEHYERPINGSEVVLGKPNKDQS